MITMHPVVLRGCTTWDRDKLPLEEFQGRMNDVKTMMREQAIDCLIVYGDVRDFAELCYLTNYIPKHSSAMVVIPSDGDPYLIAAVAGTRDLPAVQVLTWIGDIRSTKRLDDELNKLAQSVRNQNRHLTVGICNPDLMRATLYRKIREACHGLQMKDVSAWFKRKLSFKRPREAAVMKHSARILRQAVNGFRETFSQSRNVVSALIEAERIARTSGAQDIRFLFSADEGRTLQPFEKLIEHRADAAYAYIAVEYLGYWAEGFVTIPAANLTDDHKAQADAYQKASVLLSCLIGSITAGACIADVAEGASRLLGGDYALHPVVSGKFGHSIGLSLSESPSLDASSEHVIEPGTFYSLHAAITGGASAESSGNALLSAMVHVTESGSEVLWSSLE
jgi:Xaa-Pro aminopeptidase